jgi:glucose/arabinose dehydrogenase
LYHANAILLNRCSAYRSCSSFASRRLRARFTRLVSQVATGLDAPAAIAFAPDGRIFVCEQDGSLRVIKNGALLPAPFLTVNVNPLGERGLLGVAFDSNFAVNSYVYVYYTTAGAPIHNRVSRFRANGDVAVSGSEVAILDLEGLGATNHNGGAIHFGPDGKLYVAVGENANAPNAQSFANRLGKILRINGDGSIPVDNPFAAQTTGLNQAVWAMGLQNPYTFAFHPANGRMNINDVGQYTWEEVNEGIGGSNYGWPTYEGLDGRQRRLPRSADCVPSQRGRSNRVRDHRRLPHRLRLSGPVFQRLLLRGLLQPVDLLSSRSDL